ncbi:MAG TPA: enoyl-CoA hydratase/isomerase family protein [Candidatus Acidoferrum sp.]|nr:enoyl-CoA hydratase/isomerase family protein [Candidatus Acidoferrum sp.]
MSRPQAPATCFDVSERAAGVVVITARRPPVNAMSPELIAELSQRVAEVGARESARVVVFGSAIPDYFMVGFDLAFIGDRLTHGIEDHDLDELKAIARQVHRTMDAIEALPQPTIAVLSGHAVGGGFELSLACDFRIMADDPKYRVGLPEVALGLIPAGGGTQRLPALIGHANARAMLLEGRRIDARESLRMGLVHELAAPSELDAAVDAIAARLCSGGRLAQALIKQCLREGARDRDAGLALEVSGFARCVASAEAQHRIASFLKRKS